MSTGVKVGFNKDYGRQNYHASGTVVANRYKNTKNYDDDGYNVMAGVSSSMLSNWYGSVDVSAVKQQQNPEDQGTARYKENIDSQSLRLFLQYGLYGRWSVNSDYNHSKASYEVVSQYDRTTRDLRLGLRYSPTDLLYFDWGVQKTKVDSPKYPLLQRSGAISYGDPVDRYDFDLSTRWEVTGFSNLTGRIAWTREQHPNDARRDFKGLTGRLAWAYTPGGKMSYNVGLERDTNNAGGSTNYRDIGGISLPSFQAQNRVTTGINMSASWRATSKISVNSGLSYKRIKEERDREVIGGGGFFDTSERKIGSYRSFSLGAQYALARSTSLGCTAQRYDRSSSIFSSKYDGESIECNVVFTVD